MSDQEDHRAEILAGGGQPAKAVVAEWKTRMKVAESGYGGIPMGHVIWYRLSVTVEPEGAQAFPAVIKYHGYFTNGQEPPASGSTINVLYHPTDPRKIAYVPGYGSTDTAPSADRLGGDQVITGLTELADLRDRGALTDAEFEAQKQRILSESATPGD